jgi:predicted alpha/beta hydrolase family esterase
MSSSRYLAVTTLKSETNCMPELIVLPGIGNSGERHWQTLWEQGEGAMRRFCPGSWDAPELDDWCDALDRAVTGASESPILVAHSLACLLVAHWSERSSLAVRGAFLVSVPDPTAAVFPRAEAASFVSVPARRLRFPSTIIASSNDPYGPLAYQRQRASEWGSDFVEVGAFGHINAASGVGAWPEGRRLLDRFAAGLIEPVETV